MYVVTSLAFHALVTATAVLIGWSTEVRGIVRTRANLVAACRADGTDHHIAFEIAADFTGTLVVVDDRRDGVGVHRAGDGGARRQLVLGAIQTVLQGTTVGGRLDHVQLEARVLSGASNARGRIQRPVTDDELP